MSDETILVLGDLQIPIGAGREISQSLNPIDNGDLRRTVNGELLDLTRAENQKYTSTIRCTDMRTPTFASLWKGMALTVQCISILRQTIEYEDTVTLIRDPVEDSVFGWTLAEQKIIPDTVVGRDVTFPEAVDWVEFRPVLDMLVTDISHDTEEYAAVESWQLDLEEV